MVETGLCSRLCIYLGFGLKPVYLQGQGKEVAHQRAVTDE